MDPDKLYLKDFEIGMALPAGFSGLMEKKHDSQLHSVTTECPYKPIGMHAC